MSARVGGTRRPLSRPSPRVRLTFRFSPQDGFQALEQGTATATATEGAATAADEGEQPQGQEQLHEQEAEPPYDPADPAQNPPLPPAGPGLMPTGETAQQWFDRVVAEAEELAAAALAHIPLADTSPSLSSLSFFIAQAATDCLTDQPRQRDQTWGRAGRAVIQRIDNIQELFGLPYTPPPGISVWLPWVELLIGGSEIILMNFVWPGKIVSYALQLEVTVRTRMTMAAPNTTTTTTSNSGAGGSTARAGAPAGTPPERVDKQAPSGRAAEMRRSLLGGAGGGGAGVLAASGTPLQPMDFTRDLVDQADTAAAALGAAAGSPALRSAAGPDGVKAAEALQAGAQTYGHILRAGQASLKRLSIQQQKNQTRAVLQQNGPLTAAERAFATRFVWNFNFVRINFRFAASDGLVTTLQQFVYQLSDVNTIISSARSLAAAFQARDAQLKRIQDQVSGAWLLPLAMPVARNNAHSSRQRFLRAPQQQYLIGCTYAWLARITAEAEAEAALAFRRIPHDRSTGLDRVMGLRRSAA
eukprot:XP_001703671.1 predicted protein [Chlamydomonas reinhardtii]